MGLLMLLTTGLVADPPPPLSPLEQAVIDAREAIRDAHLVVEIDTLDLRVCPTRTRYRYETWFEPTRQRTEITPLDADTRSASGAMPYDMILCRNCPEPGTNLGYGRNGTPVAITKPGQSSLAGGNDTGRLLDVRRLGVAFADARTLHKHPLDQAVAISRLPEFSQADEVVAGRRLVRLRGQLRPGANKTIWIDPDRGPAVVKVESAGRNMNPKLPDYRSVMEVEPARDEVSGAWYFRSCKKTVRLHGGKDADETITVQTMEINRGIDPAVFTMAALNIPAGTPAQIGNSAADAWYWDGTRMVSRAEYRKRPEFMAAYKSVPPTPAAPPPAADPRWWQYALAAVLAAAGLFAVARAVCR